MVEMTSTTRIVTIGIFLIAVSAVVIDGSTGGAGFNKKLSAITGKLHKRAVEASQGENVVISPFR